MNRMLSGIFQVVVIYLIRMKSDLLAGLRFIESIKSFVLTNESCSGVIGRIYDRGVVERSIVTLQFFNLLKMRA